MSVTVMVVPMVQPLPAWRGKQLTGAASATQTISFEYNEDGLRQKKTVNGAETDYFYNGSVLIGMQRSGTRYLFSYDASGNVAAVKYNGNVYYYVRNGQGDIVKLIDATGSAVVEYTYDTWGKAVTTTGSLAGTLGLIQPFRYRGYVYDYETGFYYLQSRYYDPTTGRFISANVLLSTGQGVLGHNCYAYCLGNPVNMADSSGARPDVSVNLSDAYKFSENYTAVRYNVPLYEQEGPYCWAYCYAMMVSYKYGKKLSKDEVDAWVQQIVNGLPFSVEKTGWFPGNIQLFGFPTWRVGTIENLYEMLVEFGPMYAFYNGSNDSHYVVITGVDVTNNIVFTNNPWDLYGAQSYEEFLNGYYTKDDSTTSALRCVFRVNWYLG